MVFFPQCRTVTKTIPIVTFSEVTYPDHLIALFLTLRNHHTDFNTGLIYMNYH